MNIDRIVHGVAGASVLASLALGVATSPVFVHANWLWMTVFVGANLLQSSVTGFCPLEIILRKLTARTS